MAPLWGQVKATVAQFIEAVPDGDELDVRLFADEPRPFLTIPQASAQSRRGALERLAAMPSPQGRHTDLGLAATAALDRISGAASDRQHFVYILTDGQQDPAGGSSFPADGTGRWPELARQASTLSSARPISFAVVRLTAAADRSLLVKTLPGAVVVDATSAADRAAWIESVVRSVAVAKLRLQIAFERSRPALTISTTERVRAGNATAATVATSRPTLRPVLKAAEQATLSNGLAVSIARRGPRGEVRAGDTIGVAIGEDQRPWYLPPAGADDSLVVSLPARIRLTPEEELARIGVAAESPQDSVRVIVTLAAVSFVDYAKYGAAVVLIALAGWGSYVRIKWSAHRPAFRGELRIRHRDSDSEEVVPLSTVSPPTYDIITAGQGVVRLAVRSERGKSELYIAPLQPGVFVSGRPLTKQEHFRWVALDIRHESVSASFFPTPSTR